MSAVELHLCRTTLPSGHLQGGDVTLSVLPQAAAQVPGSGSPTEGGSRGGTQWGDLPQLRLGSTLCCDQRPHEVPQVIGELSISHAPLTCPPSSSDVTTLRLLREKLK